MKFLFVSDFTEDANSGSAGSIVAVGTALGRRGHQVDYHWRDERPARLPHASLYRLFELPRRQLESVRESLSQQFYDVVMVSQPYAYLIYERLPKLYPRTLFLNRTHGWEDRHDRAAVRFHWISRNSLFSRAGAGVTRRLTRLACARTARSCQGLISPSRRCAEFVSSAYEVPVEKVAVIPYGAPDVRLARAPVASGSAASRLLFVGTYLARKGSRVLETVLPPIARGFAETRLTFVTNREAVSQVRAQFSGAFGDRLTVHEWMPREELYGIYAEHDVLLFPSLFEGFGKTFLEAMACGLCVVGFDEGGLADIAISGQEALHCTTGDVQAFRTLLERCLTEPTLARTIGTNARARAMTLTWDRNAEATEQFCLDLLQQHSMESSRGR
jgi:glycosyltransferase involved in cell wall biosynthesis